MFLQNVRKLLPGYMVSYLRRHELFDTEIKYPSAGLPAEVFLWAFNF
jgi:hypothetical protein